LGAQGCELRRHRLFESNLFLWAPPCRHSAGAVIGVYGGHARKDAWEGGHKTAASLAMQITWATLAEMSEAIPPAYTKFIGEQLLAHLQSQSIAA
jgi:DNA (cytosine-5)-methyltransferase 1